jgi:uncharacterized protein (DUF488 family)
MNLGEAPLIYTIGHSTHATSQFVELLTKHCVDVVADVRSSPYSRFQPQYNREELRNSLRSAGVQYVFLGAELGARSNDPNCYVEGRVQYDRLAQGSYYRQGIDRLIDGASSHVIAIMCSEKDPLECHRTLLVAQTLVARGLKIAHILADGTLETHESSLSRLLRQMGLPEEDVFGERTELVSVALKKQEHRIAYVDKNLTETVGSE